MLPFRTDKCETIPFKSRVVQSLRQICTCTMRDRPFRRVEYVGDLKILVDNAVKFRTIPESHLLSRLSSLMPKTYSSTSLFHPLFHTWVYAGIGRNNISNSTHLITFCFDINGCSFRDTIYKFAGGLLMGSSLTLFVADIFLHKFEKDTLTLNIHSDNFIWWLYVDSAICMWRRNDQALTDFLASIILAFINSYSPKLNFKLELGG